MHQHLPQIDLFELSLALLIPLATLTVELWERYMRPLSCAIDQGSHVG